VISADETVFEHDVEEVNVHDTPVAEPFTTMVIVAVVAASDFTLRFLNVPERWIGVDATASLVNVSALENRV
jgi:hypothetical protein